MITSESVNNFSTISTIANEGDSTNESIQHKNEIENELERSLIDSAKKVKHDLHLEQESKLDDYRLVQWIFPKLFISINTI